VNHTGATGGGSAKALRRTCRDGQQLQGTNHSTAGGTINPGGMYSS